MSPAILKPADGPALRDIHLPPPPDWWPPAPGWWAVAAICVLLLIMAALWLRKARAARRQQRAILRELDLCIAEANGDAVALAASLSHFLRRMTLRDTPQAAAYAGERWLEYLDTRGATDEFRRGIGRMLIEAPYRPAVHYDTGALAALVRRWTRGALLGDAHV
jgi:hypothetical protein